MRHLFFYCLGATVAILTQAVTDENDALGTCIAAFALALPLVVMVAWAILVALAVLFA